MDWEIEAEDGSWDDHTTLNNATQGFEQFELGTGDCNPGGGNNCSGGQNPFYIDSNPGGSPGQMSWTLSLNGVVNQQWWIQYERHIVLGPDLPGAGDERRGQQRMARREHHDDGRERCHCLYRYVAFRKHANSEYLH